jgi:hypothetical protein
MTNKYEVVEMEKNTRHENGTPIVNDRWPCESETEALNHAHVRQVEAEIQGRTDVYFEARKDGQSIDLAGWEIPDDDVVFEALAEMGYTKEEILSVLQ